ncbi:uncharacterized protein LOC116005888 [Ipomoea triloba]|uniref:uncharacterized protein LOC116005888 n=1 Tax=Ipomoea triloba TaxID=35885 RepID=UPI00125D0E95|nr:uncharacterized protein LOC116005888 [Ipomoea triloba]
MSTLSWNCRGLGNPRTVREVVDMVSRKKPDFVFLMEIKVGRTHAKRLRVKLGFEGLFYVDSIGRSGGLTLLWKRNNIARLLTYSKNHVDVEVCMTGVGLWRMTGFNGFPERSRRDDSWALLRSLAGQSALPWVILGDFNDLLFQHEKRGGNPHPDSLLRGFGEAIDECELVQLPMRGYPFTWVRGKGTPEWMEERLDKVLARADWSAILPNACVTNILTHSSDHSALYLGVMDVQRRHVRGSRPFRFEMAWLLDEGCRGQVEEAWYASARKKKNSLLKLKNESSVWVEGDDLNALVLSSYSHIFASNIVPSNLDSFTAAISPRVTQSQNEALLRPFELDEVKTALFGGDVSSFVIKCLSDCFFPAGLNNTNVVLIPKKNNPEVVSDLRPIALCNVVYKVMAKMVAKRMKPLLGTVISDSQSAFIPNRLITDNILIAAEVGHYLHRKQGGIVGWEALKLDMTKAYDRMEWPFFYEECSWHWVLRKRGGSFLIAQAGRGVWVYTWLQGCSGSPLGFAPVLCGGQPLVL